jgi:hypothetical protein
MRLSLSLVAPVALTAPSHAKVWRVGLASIPNVDFNAVQPAIDAAADGDTLLLMYIDGPPADWVIDGKSLVIVKHPNMGTAPFRSCVIRNLAAGQSVALVNLASDTLAAQPLSIHDNQGNVWLQGCSLKGGAPGSAAVDIRASAAVHFFDVFVVGWPTTFQGPLSGVPGAGALRIESSSVEIDGSQLWGGNGFSKSPGAPGALSAGADALVIESGELLLSNALVNGGNGGSESAPFAPCASYAPGGSGVVLGAGQPLVHARKVTAQGGGHLCFGAPTAPAVVVNSGAIDVLPPTLRSLAFTWEMPVFEAPGWTFGLFAPAGEYAFYGISGAPAWGYVPAWSGVLAVAPTPVIRFAGVVPASGVLYKTADLPALPPGVALQLYYQPAFVDPTTGALALGKPQLALLLDDGLQ